MQDIVAGQGLAVIDPHGDLYQNLVCASSRPAPPLSPTSRPGDSHQSERSCEDHQGIQSVGAGAGHSTGTPSVVPDRCDHQDSGRWKSSAAPRMLRLITYSFLTLAEFGMSLVDLPRFLTDRQWRQSLDRTHQAPGGRRLFSPRIPDERGSRSPVDHAGA